MLFHIAKDKFAVCELRWNAHVPIVCESNYSWHSNNNYSRLIAEFRSAQKCVPKLTRWCSRPCRISKADCLSLCQIKILGLLRRSLRNCSSVHSKKLLYISLVRFQLIYGSQVWRPYLLKDIDAFEAVQHQRTNLFLMTTHQTISFASSHFNLLPLMILYELNDILYVRHEGHSSSGCSTPARYSDMHCSNSSQTLLQCFNDAVITFIRQEKYRNDTRYSSWGEPERAPH